MTSIECVICLQPIEGFRVPLECGHDQFHPECLLKAVRINPACPLCRDIPEDETTVRENEEEYENSLLTNYSNWTEEQHITDAAIQRYIDYKDGKSFIQQSYGPTWVRNVGWMDRTFGRSATL